MEKLKLHISAIAHNEGQPNNYIVLLNEEEGERRLPIVIGSYEAQAIAIAAEGLKPARPLTHDLLFNALQTFDIQLSEIVISDLKDGVFYATLVCDGHDGSKTEIDSRTSDALALAIRFGCPIFTYPQIMNEAGVVWDIDEENADITLPEAGEEEPVSIQEQPTGKLKILLQEALETEDFEKAAEIRDELNRRKS